MAQDYIEPMTDWPSPKPQDPFLRNVAIARNEAARGFDYRLSYDDDRISTHVDFTVTDAEIAAAPDANVLIAERRGEAREKLKNAVICLDRLLPRRPEPERLSVVSSFSVFPTTSVSSCAAVGGQPTVRPKSRWPTNKTTAL